MQKRKIILASRSPRRKNILKQIGLDFDIRESEFKENFSEFKNPHELVKSLALGKARDVARYYDDAIIIGADSLIFLDDKAIGKPKNEEKAKEILKSFSGREHKAITGFVIMDTKNNIVISDTGEAIVKFRNLSDEDINEYVASGEPFGKAGAYSLMEKAAVLVEKIDGDFYSIIGLPLNKVYCKLKELGAV